jgi:hypothetical protein
MSLFFFLFFFFTICFGVDNGGIEIDGLEWD